MMMKSLYSVQEQDLKSNIYSANLQELQATCRNVATLHIILIPNLILYLFYEDYIQPESTWFLANQSEFLLLNVVCVVE